MKAITIYSLILRKMDTSKVISFIVFVALLEVKFSK